ncbi:hypothetical protein JQ609_30930 [Bradyrhizobium sp. AUGA SZCCT0169]|jgi:hypothetical protein|uniref:hypothetical protein n=1 Tax=Bradyrhizobium sp. AUGA SZCCT0169 TaxID=2807663 RepID=UPI001BA55158|nr:hypothetical protein [Bradyrhizobium sp. AUGA SZCCT0169]MBR1251321.1 hypothetical protein [Bradyrhizobium sp. AUGA SZCCT0169]
MLFYPFYPALMLAVEAQNVIDMRLWKIATGGVHAAKETQLMVSEKIDAAVEASAMLMGGKTTGEVIDFYRKQVAANATRLT